MSKKLLIVAALIFIFSCKKNVNSEKSIYYNNFETGDLTNITGGMIGQFNGTAVLGQYNKGNFTLLLKNLPKHDLITVTFDLYIHDSWDGNKKAPDGPDIWQMLVDGSSYIYTTFSNAPCSPGNFCTPQAYPANYPNNENNPRTGAYSVGYPGYCSNKSDPTGTTLYKITKTFKHSESTLKLTCLDKLVQPNAPDEKCDESWSVDNIAIKAIAL